jgi:hypothetical protein
LPDSCDFDPDTATIFSITLAFDMAVSFQFVDQRRHRSLRQAGRLRDRAGKNFSMLRHDLKNDELRRRKAGPACQEARIQLRCAKDPAQCDQSGIGTVLHRRIPESFNIAFCQILPRVATEMVRQAR